MKSFVRGGIILSLIAGVMPARASVATFNFEARLAGPISQSGDISSLHAYPFEVNNGAHIIDGSFSYDTSQSPFAGFGNYFPTALSFTVGGISFSTTLAEVNITDSAADAFNTTALFNYLAPDHDNALANYSFTLGGPNTIFNSVALPGTLDLSDFTSQRLFTISETDQSPPFGNPVGTYTIPFQVTELEQVSTPLPATFPLFAGGLGLIGLLARHRKQRRAASV